MPEPPAAKLAGLLADEERLLVFAAVALGATTVDEVVAATGLDRPAVVRALDRLAGGGYVDRDESGLAVARDALSAAARDRPPRRRELPGATAAQAKVLQNFVEDGRLRALPARAGQRRVVLEYMAGLFEPGVDYDEGDVNETLRLYFGDHAALRRYLVDEGLLEREGGVYRRPAG